VSVVPRGAGRKERATREDLEVARKILDALLESGGNCTPVVLALAEHLGLKIEAPKKLPVLKLPGRGGETSTVMVDLGERGLHEANINGWQMTHQFHNFRGFVGDSLHESRGTELRLTLFIPTL
jgi:hypothetical protein